MFLFVLKCDLQIMRAASLLSFRHVYIQHRLHTYSHTRISHTASTDLGGWRTVPPRDYSLGFFHLDTSLFCRDPLSLLTSDLLLQTGDSSVHFMSDLHILCSDSPQRKNPGWQVFTKVQSKVGRSMALMSAGAGVSGWWQAWAKMGFSPLVSPL